MDGRDVPFQYILEIIKKNSSYINALTTVDYDQYRFMVLLSLSLCQ